MHSKPRQFLMPVCATGVQNYAAYQHAWQLHPIPQAQPNQRGKEEKKKRDTK
jgi:hypothetical protein